MVERTKTSPTKKKLIFATGAAALIALAVFSQFIIWRDIPEITGPPIPYAHLSSEEAEPFLKFGKKPEDFGPSSRIKGRYSRAVWRWPDVRSCLVRSERQQETPDLRNFNWRNMRADAHIEVCMYRIFASLGTPKKSKLWLESQGLQNTKIVKRTARKKIDGEYVFIDNKSVYDEFVWVTASNYPKRSRDSYVPSAGFLALTRRFLYNGENFTVVWSNKRKTLETSYGASGILN